MKKFFLAMMLVITLTLANTCTAQDIWVDHWQSENFDIYAMDDTLRGDTNEHGRYFKVSCKMIKNGQLQQIVNWTFSQMIFNGQYDNWRYETSTMRGAHTSIVYNSKLFEFCMNKLGWSYNKHDGYYN